MSEGLDFSDLTDDQIVELAAALAHEALRRSPAMVAAFEAALVDEKQRAEAMARGAARAKARTARDLEEVARRAEHQQQQELLRQKRRDAMAVFLRQAAAITDRHAATLTLVWSGNYYGKGPRLHLNTGTTGRDADWHLVDFSPATQALRTSPGLRGKTLELLQWAREASAAAAAIEPIACVIQGIEI